MTRDLQVHLDSEAPLDLQEILVYQVTKDWSKEFDDDFVHQWIIKSKVIKSAFPLQGHLGSKDPQVQFCFIIRFLFFISLCLRNRLSPCQESQGIPDNLELKVQGTCFLWTYNLNFFSLFKQSKELQTTNVSFRWNWTSRKDHQCRWEIIINPACQHQPDFLNQGSWLSPLSCSWTLFCRYTRTTRTCWSSRACRTSRIVRSGIQHHFSLAGFWTHRSKMASLRCVIII